MRKSIKNVPAFGLALLVFLAACTKEQKPLSTVRHPGWSLNKTIYELNIRQFSQSGTFAAVEQRLPGLRELGVGIIWLMPIHPIGEKNRKGSLGSYYAVRDYRAVNPDYGTMDDFQRLVGKIHDLGMYVILDWVANHTARDNPLVEQHPDWFTRDSLGNVLPPVADWTDVADLNYDNKEVWRYMIDAMKFWVRQGDVDGFRCDVAEMVPLEFWEQARAELEQIKPVFMLAEGEAAFLHDRAFDMTYSWNLFHIMNKIAAGDEKVSAIDSLLVRESALYPAGAMRMRFTSNHDENSWNGTVFERLGDGARAFAVICATIPGKPLLYSGQEAGMDKRLSFFEKDPIEWRLSKFRRFYQLLFIQYEKNPALHAGSYKKIATDRDEAVYAFVRKKDRDQVLVLVNLSADSQHVTIESEELDKNYIELFTGLRARFGQSQVFDLEPWAYRVYVRKE